MTPIQIPICRWHPLAGLLLALGCAAVSSGQSSLPLLPEPASYGNRLEIQRDIAFGQEHHQQLDLYLPSGPGPFPVVICWFGGGFTRGSKENMAPVAAFLASRGLAVVAPGYYLADSEGMHPAWPASLHDAKAAVRFIRGNAGRWRLDADRITALGHSSGAYLALMVGFTSGQPQLDQPNVAGVNSCQVSAVVAISGVCDRRGSLGSTTIPLLGRGYEQNVELRTVASPVIYIDSKTVPVYILHGANDPTVDVASARQLAEALKLAHVPHRLNIVPGGHNPISLAALSEIVDWLKQSF